MGFRILNKSEESYFNSSNVWATDFDILQSGNSFWVVYEKTGSRCQVTEPASGGRNVDVASGICNFGNVAFVKITGTTVALTPADTQPRIDLIEVNSSGTISAKDGVSGLNPSPPSLTSGSVALAYVYNDANDTGSIKNSNILDKRVVRGDGGRWDSWTPQLTSSGTTPSLGNNDPNQEGYYTVIGDWVLAYGVIAFGTDGVSAGTGTYRVSLPVTPDITQSWNVGTGMLRDDDLADSYSFVLILNTSISLCNILADNQTSLVTASTPITWNELDTISFCMSYKAA